MSIADLQELGTLATGLYDFEGVRDDNLPFKKGEVITIIEMNETGWWKGVNSTGKVGIFPYNYVAAKEDDDRGYRIVKAIDDYEQEDEDELTFSKGDMITILKPVDAEWSEGRLYSRSQNPSSRLAERIVGRFQLAYVEDTDDYDKFAGIEEQEIQEKEIKSRQRYSMALQKKRKERESQSFKEIEKKKAELAETERQKAEIIAKENEIDEAEQKATLKRKEQEALQLELEKEKQRLEDEMEKMKQIMLKHEREIEEARKRAQEAEDQLEAAKAEKQRLQIIAEKQFPVDETKAKKLAEERKQAIQEKAKKTLENNRDEDGFVAPAPRPAKVKVLSKFAKLGKSKDLCPACGKPVGFGPHVVNAMGKKWHRECFACGVCGKTLRGEWLEHKGFPYDPKCHRQAFGIKGFGFGGAVAETDNKRNTKRGARGK